MAGKMLSVEPLVDPKLAIEDFLEKYEAAASAWRATALRRDAVS
jgi:hypothetical protein